MRKTTLLLVAVLALTAGPAFAQHLHTELFISGLRRPVAFVQDPSQANVQFVVEQRGRIRPVVDGRLHGEDFLDLSGIVSSNNEGGLLGLAFAPDYASSGRLFVNFTNEEGHTVIARFTRAGDSALRGNLDSRFDLVWPDGNAFITQPYCCHYGGDLKFGPDGYLYIGLGDGGAWDDPDHVAQNPQSLLGKMLRIDVAVADDDGRGYTIPGDNPWMDAAGVLPEIWSAGLRNPWRYTFDDPARGGTGALIISDVGQNGWEEFNYEPRGAGGRNYGWRNREGGHEYLDTAPAWFEPLVDPTYEYAHGGGLAIIGGYVYRGAALDPSFVGRYFFGDFMSGQLWSIGLNVDSGSGEAVAGNLIEHTAESTQDALNLFTAFGEDAAGELYITNWWNGTIYRVLPGPPPPPPAASDVLIVLDTPASGQVTQPLTIAGWALDRMAQKDTGVDYVEIWATPRDGSQGAQLLGRGTMVSRPDVADLLGPQFQLAGFALTAPAVRPGAYQINAYAHSASTKKFEATASAIIDVASSVRMAIDQPSNGQTAAHEITISGWALDTAATSGTGVDTVHIWAFPADGGSPVWVGTPAYGHSRGDVGAVFGARFADVGFWLNVANLAPGSYRLMLYAHSTVDSAFTGQGVDITIAAPSSEPKMALDVPVGESVQTGAFRLAGWALDRGASTGTGVDAVHVWAFPVAPEGAPFFLGQADYGVPRPDVAGVFGGRFVATGYHLNVAGLPSGRYQVGVYVHSSLANAFNQVRFVYLIVP